MSTRPSAPLQALVFALLALLAIYAQIAPMQLTTDSRVLPDVLLAMAAAWFIRQPEALPLVLVAGVFLLADLVQDRPTGLWALLSLLMLEALGSQREALRNRPFPVEWAAFTAALAIALILRALILRLALVEPSPGGVSAQLFAMTVLSYPVVVLVLHYLLRIRSPKPAERSRRLGRVP